MSLGDRFAATMDAARRGDEQAIATLYADANPVLLRYLRAREPQDADDLASETWILLARQLTGFVGDERGWWALVFLVARRCLNDHWKRRRRRRTESVSVDTLADRPSSFDVEAAGIQSLADRDAFALVTGCLPPEQADVILLRVVAGLDVGEVAAAIGKRPGTVRVMQHRALNRLAAYLAATPNQLGPTGTASPSPPHVAEQTGPRAARPHATRRHPRSGSGHSPSPETSTIETGLL